MKKIVLCLMVTISALSCSKAQNKEFSKESLSKKLISPENKEIAFSDVLKKHLGKVTVIEVWASWCGDCVKAMPKVKEMQSKNPNVDYVFISMDKAFDKWQAGIEKHELKGDHYWVTDGMKGEYGKSIDLDWIPRYIVIDKKGKIIIYRAIETDFDKINEQLKKLE
ncbi:TlpA disulfide reductase family protein [Flavobacterium paronense]|uniref:TlpA family protein disulfide reductase n=1 Tax=Flavobacterium paronense TaxID=1392775 RepID=A0ABV5GFS3_9FLAO|nr:TlpA disulfide reductase family protein [Flavobacterium paronense]MDN3676586.1 TlpA disulfide reductase family protein [Flavobacterium paronense]